MTDNGTVLKHSSYNLPNLEGELADLERRDIVGRIWIHDHTVWKPDPFEISDRLGWLWVTDQMSGQLGAIKGFVSEVRGAGFQHVVLLGMGGSSLGAEVLRLVFGSAKDYPELIVLDSTVPEWVEAVAQRVDPLRTLFLVSSKSGTTTEPNFLYAYFRSLLDQKGHLNPIKGGSNFAAITDAGTPLEQLAKGEEFRRIFINPPDIGGRYSVLSYFGLVPAALIGMELPELIHRADTMRGRCSAIGRLHENPGAWLGLIMGKMALQGRDKLTLITSPSLAGFGLWVEQLLAESTGKEGRGIVPVSGEPLVDARHYGHDRLFIYLRLEQDENSELDGAIESIQLAGHPLVRTDLQDKYDLGGEFYRWEFATALAGAVLDVNPFDQPDVQAAKDMTNCVLAQYQAFGRWPSTPTFGGEFAALGDLLTGAGSGDYLVIMAYLQQTPQVDQALNSLRRRVLERYGISTTVGYGPRLLHSTGQLHKGGPNSGLFLQLTQEHSGDVPIAGQPYTFGVLADAQAMGDYQALNKMGRRTARLHLAGDPGAVIAQIVEQLKA